MRCLLFLAVFSFSLLSIGQNPNLHFGGDANVNLGADVLEGARTIELWFKLDSDFNESSTSPMSLIARNTSGCNECDEVQLVLIGPPLDSGFEGSVRFGWQSDIGANPQKIFSDTSSWQAGKWYHVAGVFDPINGMSLFINGVKQSQTISTQINAATSSEFSTYLGQWGDAANQPRRLKGNLENVRISSVARYSANFSPNCMNDTVDSFTQAMYFLNAGSGTIAIDSSGNQYQGSINNATWDSDSFCVASIDPHDNPHGDPSIINELNSSSSIRIFPNPSRDRFFTIESNDMVEIKVYSVEGNLVFLDNQLSTNQINLSQLAKGTYMVKVKSEKGFINQLPLILL